MPPLVSVCLPVFNGAHYLASAVESVLSQTHGDFELVISDDGSTDGSLRIIEHYARLDRRIKYSCNERPAGLFANYNLCLQKAQGQLIKPFAQDDLLHPGMIEKCCRIMQLQGNVALISVGRTFIGEDGEEVAWEEGDMSPYTVLGKAGLFKARNIMAACLNPLTNFIGEPCAVLYRAQHAGTGFDEQLHHVGDLEYWLRILRQGDYYFLDEELAQFRRHRDSASQRNWRELKMAPDIIRVSYVCADMLQSFGMNREEFVQNTLSELAGVVAQRYRRDEIDLPRAPKGSPPSTLETESWQEALLHALLLMGQGYNNALVRGYAKALENEQVIAREEQHLRRLLKSFSWRSTRLFRELRAGLLPIEQQVLDELNEQRSACDPLSRQESYLRYLRKKTAKIKSSRSWALTAPLRALASLTGGDRDVPKGEESSVCSSDMPNAVRSPESQCTSSSPPVHTGADPARPQQVGAKTFNHQLAIGAIFKNQARYLSEWIEFYRLLGVQKFYLFNNLSTDNYLAVLSPYLADGTVDLTEWPVAVHSQEEFNSMQCSAYEKIIAMARDSKWLALLDIDEFMYPVEADSLLDVLNEYEEFGGLSVNWRCFGTGGVQNVRDDQLLIEALTRRAEDNHPRNLLVKTVSVTSRIGRCYNPHFVRYADPYLQVNEDRVPFRGFASPYPTGKKIVINHYWCGDESHFFTRKLPAMKAYQSTVSDEDVQAWLREFNAVEDKQILRFADKLKARVLPNCRSEESRI